MTKKMTNGRSSLEELKQKYEKVFIRHEKDPNGTVKSTCLLVDGKSIFVGVSKFSNRGDSFEKRKGRLIAQGRAELAADIASGKVSPRISHQKRREQLSYKITIEDSLALEFKIDELLGRTVKVTVDVNNVWINA